MADEIAVREASPAEVTLALTWQSEDGALRGKLEVCNTSGHRVRLSGKPRLCPLGAEGNPLEIQTVVTMELAMPGHVELDPGECAFSNVGWAGWNGPVASGSVLVEWPGGQVEVRASGPHQPSATGPATNLWSTWFER